MSNLIPVVLCGGVGSRLWPISRKTHPKPFITLKDGENLLQKSFKRGAFLKNTKEIMTISSEALFFNIKESLSSVRSKLKKGIEKNLEKDTEKDTEKDIELSYILEPFGRNTAAAIAMACLKLKEKHGPDVELLVLAADHLVEDQITFSESVEKAQDLVKENKIVTFGIYPTRAETGYGYIDFQKPFKLLEFVEKPDSKRAQEFVKSGHHLWNSGMFCFRAQTMLEEMEKYAPEILNGSKQCFKKSIEDSNVLKLDPNSFKDIPNESIDCAVLEKTNCGAVVPCEIGWTDIGCFKSLGELSSKDESNNRGLDSSVIFQESKNCFVRNESKVTTCLLGVENLVVINTPDALLVTKEGKTQEVKKVYERLVNENCDSHKFHRTVYRPWGFYTVLEESDFCKVKKIEVKVGARLSLQMHHKRSEHWTVVKGKARVINGEEELFLAKNDSIYIPQKNRHCLENVGEEPLVVIEVQTGSYLGEDDIVRFQDIYGRV